MRVAAQPAAGGLNLAYFFFVEKSKTVGTPWNGTLWVKFAIRTCGTRVLYSIPAPAVSGYSTENKKYCTSNYFNVFF
eukprot:SAG31_NODE_1722_length_7452_cov_2.771658_2_plen_77_part_00